MAESNKGLGIKINKVYVINLKHRKDRWDSVQEKFKGTDLKLTRFNAINGKDLDDDQIQKMTTNFCYYFCSPGMIGCWLSHYKLWEEIVKGNNENVLILEDDAYPVDDYNKRINQVLNEIPKNYDLVYFGCNGSCDEDVNWFYRLFYGEDKEIYLNGKKSQNFFRPKFPLTTHAYLISKKGAQKLLNNKNIQKITYHVDYSLCKYVYSDEEADFKMMAIRPPLINQPFESTGSDIASSEHPIVNEFLSNVKLSEMQPTDYIGTVQLLNLRKLGGISITIYSVSIFIISFILGFLSTENTLKNFVGIMFLIYLTEFILKRGKNIKILIFELFLIILCAYLGYFLRSKIKSI